MLEDPGYLPLWQLQGDLPANDNEPLFGKNLFPEHRSKLRDPVNQYTEVIQDKPGSVGIGTVAAIEAMPSTLLGFQRIF